MSRVSYIYSGRQEAGGPGIPCQSKSDGGYCKANERHSNKDRAMVGIFPIFMLNNKKPSKNWAMDSIKLSDLQKA